MNVDASRESITSVVEGKYNGRRNKIAYLIIRLTQRMRLFDDHNNHNKYIVLWVYQL